MNVFLRLINIFSLLIDVLMTGLGDEIEPCLSPFTSFPDNLDGPESLRTMVHLLFRLLFRLGVTKKFLFEGVITGI